MPYLIGPNSAPIRPNRNSAKNRNGTEFSWKPATATAAAPISASFSRRATRALSKRSASSPPKADSRKNGAIKMPPAMVTSDSPACPPILNRISRARAFFKKLSLKAEKNWHQNSGAKRREARSDCDIDLSGDRCSYRSLRKRADKEMPPAGPVRHPAQAGTQRRPLKSRNSCLHGNDLGFISVQFLRTLLRGVTITAQDCPLTTSISKRSVLSGYRHPAEERAKELYRDEAQ